MKSNLGNETPLPMTLIKLRIKGAATYSVPATWRVAYSLPAPLVAVLPADTLLTSFAHPPAPEATRSSSEQQCSPSRHQRQPPHVLPVRASPSNEPSNTFLPPRTPPLCTSTRPSTRANLTPVSPLIVYLRLSFYAMHIKPLSPAS